MEVGKFRHNILYLLLNWAQREVPLVFTDEIGEPLLERLAVGGLCGYEHVDRGPVKGLRCQVKHHLGLWIAEMSTVPLCYYSSIGAQNYWFRNWNYFSEGVVALKLSCLKNYHSLPARAPRHKSSELRRELIKVWKLIPRHTISRLICIQSEHVSNQLAVGIACRLSLLSGDLVCLDWNGGRWSRYSFQGSLATAM